ncbi:topoisomerase DNA binding C4 zinc finger [Geobacter sp. OR-1]|uniref:four helix bundle suffix domain-containing protein n=1 Tax=Geobacter sp. OR-1 TaxID=1266765 RepID=UPI000541FEED|nr:four helix bundle suffix domain-containing protein [Geobacter sp. OR-1]GAM11102.1 topoisomerase DNA binding C4 zinc finger [Geobacter sp. OR-1]
MTTGFIPQHGGFRKLRSFQTAQLAYDGTVIFCDRFIDKRSRTNDQMVQAARSGVQNIAEGSLASATSKETEVKLTNVARASLGELLLDYEDFLRQRGLCQWGMDAPEAKRVRSLYLSDKSDLPYKSDRSDRSDSADNKACKSDIYAFRTASAEVVANTLICLINQASSLLSRQIRQLEQEFLAQGGLRERMTRARLEVREALSDGSDKSDLSDKKETPSCPKCAKPMRQRTAKTGSHAGESFWGCTGYPECTGIRSIEQ